jgi:hypothetical protein
MLYNVLIKKNPHLFPDSKPHPYIDFISSQCTVIVYSMVAEAESVSPMIKYVKVVNFCH